MQCMQAQTLLCDTQAHEKNRVQDRRVIARLTKTDLKGSNEILCHEDRYSFKTGIREETPF